MSLTILYPRHLIGALHYLKVKDVNFSINNLYKAKKYLIVYLFILWIFSIIIIFSIITIIIIIYYVSSIVLNL